MIIVNRTELCLVALLLASAFSRPSEPAAASEAELCESQKLKATRDDLRCRLSARAKAIVSGRSLDTRRCDLRIGKKFAKLDGRFGANCPTSRDGQFMADVDEFVSEQIDEALRDQTFNPFGRADPCRDGTTDPNKFKNRQAEYSPECAAYLGQCTRNAWFYRAGEAIAAEFADQVVEEFFPNGVGANPLTRAAVVNQKARILKEFYEGPDSEVDPRYAKSVGVGFRNHTYLGVYNCQSDFQSGAVETGCPIYQILHPAEVENRTYLGLVRNYDPADQNCTTVQPDPFGNLSLAQTYAQDDNKIACFPKLNRSTSCAFEIWNWNSLFNIFSDWTYLCTQKQPETSFDPVSRPWYRFAQAAFEAGSPSGRPLYLPPYQNYGTGHAIFGSATPFADATGEFAGVVLAINYIIDEPTYQEFIAECDPASRAYDPNFAFDYPPR